MKKIFIVCLLILSTVFCISAQEALTEEATPSADLDFSYLDKNLLMTVPNYFSKYEYQNRAGDFFTNKQVIEMLLCVPENEMLMKQYKDLMAATYSLLGIFVACVTVDMVYTFNERLPYRKEVNNTINYVSLMSFCGGVITGSAGKLKLNRAIDNYNYSILSGR